MVEVFSVNTLDSDVYLYDVSFLRAFCGLIGYQANVSLLPACCPSSVVCDDRALRPNDD
mgnify:FL=1